MTVTPTPTAREVVAEYLARKAEKTAPEQEREAITAAAKAIIDELPDGFTANDVRACLKALAAQDEHMSEVNQNRRGRAANKVLDAMVADGALKLDEGEYTHAAVV